MIKAEQYKTGALAEPDDLFELGKNIGKIVEPGMVFALHGDLGAGKTLFTQGLAQGLNIKDQITSPTFNLINEYRFNYENQEYPFYHMDMYRIMDEESTFDLGLEEYFNSEAIIAIEWPKIIYDYFPENFIEVNIKKFYEPDKEWREVLIKNYGVDWPDLAEVENLAHLSS